MLIIKLSQYNNNFNIYKKYLFYDELNSLLDLDI